MLWFRTPSDSLDKESSFNQGDNKFNQMDAGKVQLNSNFIAMIRNASKMNSSAEFSELISELKAITGSQGQNTGSTLR